MRKDREWSGLAPVAPDSRLARIAASIRTWWREPRLTWWFVALSIILLVLRKPWALHTPQLYAEDGTIFLTQNDQLGAPAILEPYMGYLHLLPRLTAWGASHLADPAWWPAIYNGTAFLVTVGLFIRLASPRVDLPGKPGLALAFALVAHTGEVLFNVTNLQWITAFFLLLHLFIARPANGAQRAIDLAILAIVGLTGPFAIIFLPLFMWRWWRDRNSDTLIALLVAAACAGVQAWFLVRTGPNLEHQSEPFHLLLLLAVTGGRLVVAPLIGANGARALPLPVLAALGSAFIATLALWALRPHPRRGLRAQILAAFGLILFACLYRLRPDTWGLADMANADRYFYIPRLLLAWLVIWEVDAAPRAVAFAARAVCLTAVLVQIPRYKLPTPPDYHWAEHCEPIRRGVPAHINTLPEDWWIDYLGRPPKPIRNDAIER